MKRQHEDAPHNHANERQIRYVVGNILDNTITGACDYIGHQVNCTTQHAGGLAHDIFAAYPDADNYAGGNRNVPGTAIIAGRIVNLAGQCRTGPPGEDETAETRLRWFRTALLDFTRQARETKKKRASAGQQSEKENAVISVALPVNIGCGLAGGDWRAYHAAIVDWHDENADVQLTLAHYELFTVMLHYEMHFRSLHHFVKNNVLLMQNPTTDDLRLLDRYERDPCAENQVDLMNAIGALLSDEDAKSMAWHKRWCWAAACENVQPDGIRYKLFEHPISYAHRIDRTYAIIAKI